MRIDLQEWQDLGELPDFKENPFVPTHTLSSEVKPYIEIVDVSEKGVRIRAKNYIGILSLDDDSILTISPKAPVEDFLYLLYRAQGRRITVKELKAVVKVGREKIKDYPNIFHFLLYVLLLELEKIRCFGFLKKSRYTEDTAVIKGKILLRETLKQWTKGYGNRIVCRSFDLSKDNPENRVIRFTLWMLLDLYSQAFGKELRNDFFEKYRWFEGIPLGKGVEFINTIEETITYQRLPNSRNYYYDLLNLCMFFVTHSTLEYKSAKEVKVRAFVVDMNKVFEEYIYFVLKEFSETHYEVKKFHKTLLFDNTKSYWIEPDYLISKDKSVHMIADAKYEKEPKNNDFYQVITYAARYGVAKALLIYPYWGKSQLQDKFVFKGKEIIAYRFNLLNVEKSEKELVQFIINELK